MIILLASHEVDGVLHGFCAAAELLVSCIELLLITGAY